MGEFDPENPEWVEKTCAPTFACLENPNVDTTYAQIISNNEMPYANAPDVTNPIFPLAQDFTKDIVFSNNQTVSDTPDGCQYTCNDGYRMSEQACNQT